MHWTSTNGYEPICSVKHGHSGRDRQRELTLEDGAHGFAIKETRQEAKLTAEFIQGAPREGVATRACVDGCIGKQTNPIDVWRKVQGFSKVTIREIGAEQGLDIIRGQQGDLHREEQVLWPKREVSQPIIGFGLLVCYGMSRSGNSVVVIACCCTKVTLKVVTHGW